MQREIHFSIQFQSGFDLSMLCPGHIFVLLVMQNLVASCHIVYILGLKERTPWLSLQLKSVVAWRWEKNFLSIEDVNHLPPVVYGCSSQGRIPFYQLSYSNCTTLVRKERNGCYPKWEWFFSILKEQTLNSCTSMTSFIFLLPGRA